MVMDMEDIRMKLWSGYVARRGLRYIALLAMLSVVTLPLAGCLYPKDKIKQKVPTKEAVRNVQAAINQYYADHNLLPIQNSAQDVPKYEKFKLDFKKLLTKGYLTVIPSAAFENGGHYYFIVIDEYNTPRVKLMDIVTFQQINDVQAWVKQYVEMNKGVVPKTDMMYPGFYSIDYEIMGRKAPPIRSVFTGAGLSAIVDDNGVVYVDYGLDLMQLIHRKEGNPAAANDQTDLREWLVDASDFVPVKSPEYRLVNGEPVAVKPQF